MSFIFLHDPDGASAIVNLDRVETITEETSHPRESRIRLASGSLLYIKKTVKELWDLVDKVDRR